MDSSSTPLKCKETFLHENRIFSEVELSDESKPIGRLHEFDMMKNEIWLLQCPKGMDITKLQSEKLKIPGRTNISSSEAVSMEFSKAKEQQAFAYCNRKGRYALRLLPVRGTIVVRDRLKAAETITAECAEIKFPPTKTTPMPTSIRIRHPLLGVQYQDKLQLDKYILKRLQKADEISAELLKERLNKKTILGTGIEKNSGNQQNMVFPILIDSADDDYDVEFVSKKRTKNKRKHVESNEDEEDDSNTSDNKNKKSKNSKINEELISKDLQWLKDI